MTSPFKTPWHFDKFKKDEEGEYVKIVGILDVDTVSDIVKSLINSEKRSDAVNTVHYDQQIITRLIDEINKHDKVVVEGIRQPSIIQALQSYYGSQIVDMIWLDVPTDVRKERFNKRSRPGDDQPFDQAGHGDEGLGIGDVERIMKTKGRVASN